MMAGIEHSSTTTTCESLADAFAEFKRRSSGRGLTVLITGKSGAGKSTLAANLLNLTDFKVKHSPEAVTQNVHQYMSVVHGVNVTVVDAPGLGSPHQSDTNTLAELKRISGENADVLLYCLCIGQSSRIDFVDKNIIKTLTEAFGQEFWSRVVLVLTFANNVHENGQLSRIMKDYCDKFQEKLTEVGVTFPVLPIFWSNIDKIKTTIPALPAGLHREVRLLEGRNWNDDIYLEILRKCVPESKNGLLKLRGFNWKVILAIACICAVAGAIYGGIRGESIGLVGAEHIGLYRLLNRLIVNVTERIGAEPKENAVGIAVGVVTGAAVGAAAGALLGAITSSFTALNILCSRYIRGNHKEKQN